MKKKVEKNFFSTRSLRGSSFIYASTFHLPTFLAAVCLPCHGTRYLRRLRMLFGAMIRRLNTRILGLPTSWQGPMYLNAAENAQMRRTYILVHTSVLGNLILGAHQPPCHCRNPNANVGKRPTTREFQQWAGKTKKARRDVYKHLSSFRLDNNSHPVHPEP
jgi:hypothetical protein